MGYEMKIPGRGLRERDFIAAPFFPMTLRTSGTPIIAYLATAEPAVASAAAKSGVLTGKFKPRLGST